MLALIPVKTLADAKQRLSGVLAPAERRCLTEAMLGDVLQVLSRSVERVVVCSADPRAALLASAAGCEFMAEQELGCQGLNPVVNSAAGRFASQGVEELMVVHGDLPLLTVAEVSRFVAAHRDGQGNTVTLTPDERRDGTNLLAWNPASAFQTQYGPGSFARHNMQCRDLGLIPRICVLPNAALDIDSAADFAALAERGIAPGTRTADFLAHAGAGATGLATRRPTAHSHRADA